MSWFKLCVPIIELSCSEYILLHVLGSFNRYSIFRRILENSLMLERKHERQRADNWQRRIFHIKKSRLQKLTFRGSTHSFTCLDNAVTKLPWRLVSTALMVFLSQDQDGYRRVLICRVAFTCNPNIARQCRTPQRRELCLYHDYGGRKACFTDLTPLLT